MKISLAILAIAALPLMGCGAGTGINTDPRVLPVATCDLLNDAVTRVQNKRDTVGITPQQQVQLTATVNNEVRQCASETPPDPTVVSIAVERMNTIAPPLEGVFN